MSQEKNKEMEVTPKMKVYDGGAARSGSYPRFRDVPYCLIRRIANAFTSGAKTYERPEDGFKPFEKNWKRGDLDFALDALDHAIRHAQLYKEVILARLNQEVLDPEIYDTADDHIANCGANLGMLAWFEEQGFFEPENYVEFGSVVPEEKIVVVEEPALPSNIVTSAVDKIKDVFGLK